MTPAHGRSGSPPTSRSRNPDSHCGGGLGKAIKLLPTSGPTMARGIEPSRVQWLIDGLFNTKLSTYPLSSSAVSRGLRTLRLRKSSTTLLTPCLPIHGCPVSALIAR